MHYNEKRHLHSHKALSVSVCPSSVTEYLGPLSPTIWTGAPFPTHLLFYPHNTLPSSLWKLEYPVFHLAAQWACVNVPCQLCNIISWVVASCSVPLHNLPAPVCQSMRALFLCLFEAQIWSPNGDGIKLGAESQAALPPLRLTGETLQEYDRLHNCTEEQRRLFSQWFTLSFFYF